MSDRFDWFCLCPNNKLGLTDIQKHAQKNNDNIYLIIEQAKVKYLEDDLDANEIPYYKLISPATHSVISELGPILACFQKDDSYLHEVLSDNLSGWGVMFLSSLDCDVVYEHFRRYSWVKDDEGFNNYFRFFDPNIIKAYVNFFPERLSEIFAVCSRLYLLSEKSSQVISFTKPAQVLHESFSITDADINAVESYKAQKLKEELYDNYKNSPVLIPEDKNISKNIDKYYEESIQNGFTQEEDIRPFIMACLYLGENFSAMPEVKKIRSGSQHAFSKKQKLWRFTNRRIEHILARQEEIA